MGITLTNDSAQTYIVPFETTSFLIASGKENLATDDMLLDEGFLAQINSLIRQGLVQSSGEADGFLSNGDGTLRRAASTGSVQESWYGAGRYALRRTISFSELTPEMQVIGEGPLGYWPIYLGDNMLIPPETLGLLDDTFILGLEGWDPGWKLWFFAVYPESLTGPAGVPEVDGNVALSNGAVDLNAVSNIYAAIDQQAYSFTDEGPFSMVPPVAFYVTLDSTDNEDVSVLPTMGAFTVWTGVWT